MSNLYFNEEKDSFEENTSGNEDFCSSILQPSQFEPEQKKHMVKRAMRKKLEKQSFQNFPKYVSLKIFYRETTVLKSSLIKLQALVAQVY